MKYIRYILSTAVILSLFILGGIIVSAQSDPTQIFRLENYDLELPHTVLGDVPKGVQELKREVLLSEFLFIETLYDDNTLTSEFVNSGKKVREDFLITNSEYRNVYRKLSDKEFIASNLRRFNVQASDIDMVVYKSANEDIWNGLYDYIPGECDLEKTKLYEGFVYTDTAVYVIYIPIEGNIPENLPFTEGLEGEGEYHILRDLEGNVSYYLPEGDVGYNIRQTTAETYEKWFKDRVYEKKAKLTIDSEETPFQIYCNKYYQLIPLRDFFEYIGAAVEWNDKDRTVDINYKDKDLKIYTNNYSFSNDYGDLNIECRNDQQNFMLHDMYVNIDGRIYLIRPKRVKGDFLSIYLGLKYSTDQAGMVINSGYKWNGIELSN